MLKRILNFYFGKKIKNSRVIPLSTKIVFVFAIVLLVSNFSTNFINLNLNQNLLKKYLKTILLKDLKEIIQIANNQFEIFSYTSNFEDTQKAFKKITKDAFPSQFSLVFAIRKNSNNQEELIFSSKEDIELKPEIFDGIGSEKFKKNNINEIEFSYNQQQYIGVYRYHKNFDFFLVRAEEENSYKQESKFVSFLISIIIICITIISSFLGFYFINHITSYLQLITEKIMEMQENKKLSTIDLSKASNDQVTYLGMAFNSLSFTMQNLLDVFRKFVSNDLVQKAYQERVIKLEGEKKELTILFTDIKKFTFITETLGNDVIKLLNLFYDKSIDSIISKNGIIGSIIGDALLAIFGTLPKSHFAENKSYAAVMAGFNIIETTNKLRKIMIKRKETFLKNNRKKWSTEEEKIFKAVMLDIGVGIDGGEVFYGNIGSNKQMTNTVIGDNVNSASRLEGLTRIYSIPMICSQYVKKDIEKNISNSQLNFIEIDQVQVKGKTQGKVIYFPIQKKEMTNRLKKDLELYKIALTFYYQGKWEKANLLFKKIKEFKPSQVLYARTKSKAPHNWQGSWLMESK